MYPVPDSFLVARKSKAIIDRQLLVPCARFEDGEWRSRRLAHHLTDWLPEFVFRPDDLPSKIANTTEVRQLMERAVAHLYSAGAQSRRGELGELLLHVCCRQFFGTFPAVSKLFYKTSSNEVVKGFDLAHVRTTSGEHEVWLGEAKFYRDGSRAIAEAIKSVRLHLERGFLKGEKIMLGGKISPSTPGYERLQWMFDVDTPLDEIFDRIVVPILITFESNSCSRYRDEANYETELETELVALDDRFSGHGIPVSIMKIMLPMKSKAALQAEFDRRLGFLRP